VTSPRRDQGYALAGLVAAITIMLIGLGVAAPTWRYIMKDDREQELIFRGEQIADAVARYQKKHANALPPSLEVLVKGKFLRKEWKEPFAKDGKWRFIRQGEGVAPIRPPGSPQTPTTTRPLGPGISAGPTVGGFIGVASTSTDKSLRIFNGRQRYNEWIFAVGQPRVVGKQATVPGIQPGAPGIGSAPSRPPGLPTDPGGTAPEPDLP
jgi:type II secretory pathway pseudopilin PulG